MHGVIKGSSSRPDSARVLLELHVEIVRLQCDPWVGFVYSEDNIADLPSRGEFALLRSLGAIEREMVLPELDGCFGTM